MAIVNHLLVHTPTAGGNTFVNEITHMLLAIEPQRT
jgi:hypothetical protein